MDYLTGRPQFVREYSLKTMVSSYFYLQMAFFLPILVTILLPEDGDNLAVSQPQNKQQKSGKIISIEFSLI